MRRANHERSVSVRAIPVVATVAITETVRVDAPRDPDAAHRAREALIQKRIESRLPGRVRNLAVRSFDALVILEGQCATYYTKQLAQHAAMGILEEDEHLENSITVCIE